MLARLDTKADRALLESLEHVAPDLRRYIVEFVYGDIYPRARLTLAQRQLVTIATLTALGGCEPQLRFHIAGAFEIGLTHAEVSEVIVQTVPYVGFARALNAMSVLRGVLGDRVAQPAVKAASRRRNKRAQSDGPQAETKKHAKARSVPTTSKVAGGPRRSRNAPTA